MIKYENSTLKIYIRRKQQLKRCYDKQLVHITGILRSKSIFSSLESFQTLQLLNTHLVNFKFVLRNYLIASNHNSFFFFNLFDKVLKIRH
jgi:hypothetical protein